MTSTFDLSLKMTVEDLEAFLDREFPQLLHNGRSFKIEAVRPGEADLRMMPTDRHMRPGGTVSGPTLMALADVASYIVILAHIGPVALAVTTNLNMNFLRRPEQADLLCTCRFLKLGKRLAVTESSIRSGGDLVAHATATYSIPPNT